MLYDGVTLKTLSWLEGLGFCGLGGARDFIDEGRGIAGDGASPSTRTEAGSEPDAHTATYCCARRRSLRENAMGRQVRDPKMAVEGGPGTFPGTSGPSKWPLLSARLGGGLTR